LGFKKGDKPFNKGKAHLSGIPRHSYDENLKRDKDNLRMRESKMDGLLQIREKQNIKIMMIIGRLKTNISENIDKELGN